MSRSCTFLVDVAIDEPVFADKTRLNAQTVDIIASFAASLDHWIAEQRLELK